jgi:hypothetical protein
MRKLRARSPLALRLCALSLSKGALAGSARIVH